MDGRRREGSGEYRLFSIAIVIIFKTLNLTFINKQTFFLKINVLEPHPSFPFVATSGIDDDIKIWVSSSEKVGEGSPIVSVVYSDFPFHLQPPTMEGLKKCVQNNFESRVESGDMMGNEILAFFMRQCMRRGENQERNSRNEQLVADLISSDSDDEYEDSTSEKLRAMPCAPS